MFDQPAAFIAYIATIGVVCAIDNLFIFVVFNLNSLGGSMRGLMLEINKFCWSKFSATRAQGGVIHEMDIRKWGKQRSIEVKSCNNSNFSQIFSKITCFFSHPQIGMNNFKASRTWVNNWKKTHRIKTRKITKVLSKKEITPIARQQVQDAIQNFRNEFKAAVENKDPVEI